MIVDLLRNDIGRVCEYGSVKVEKLCEVEAHPTFFHLVSTVSGDLRDDVNMSDILTALFPCGSITGAPKISTMRIIEQIETVNRGLSMGAIGYSIPADRFGMPKTTDLSVAIRTMTIEDDLASFNVGGGIVIDSDPESEYEETLTKAKALISALGGNLSQVSGV
jgi:anthranilate/para-aminobenzoate synthase component I